MRGLKGLAVCAVLWAQGVAAQEQPAEQESPLAARWSLGAGLGWSGVYFASGGGVLGGGLGPLGIINGVVGRTSLEYLLNENLALMLGGAGSYSRYTSEVEGATEQMEPQKAYGFIANVGLRKFVAAAGATRFSAHGLLNVSLSRRESPITSIKEERSRSVFVSAGIAVDRPLLERLSLRVSADLLSVGRTSLRQTLGSPAGGPDTEAASDLTSASFYLSPSLELRLAF